MKRNFQRVLVLFMIMLLGIAPSALAFDASLFEDSTNGAQGLISMEDTGNYIVMLQLRLRELGYFHFKPTGRFQRMTEAAVIQFQTNQMDGEGKAIIADGTVGQQTVDILFSKVAVRCPIPQNQHLPIGPRADGSQTEKGTATEWSEVKQILNAGSSYKLMDYNTGKTFEVIFTGGENHAEVECKNASDASVYKDVFGGVYNFSKRPMLLSMNGAFVACSLQGEPHGEDTVSGNDMDGHACLYFKGSLSHIAGLSDPEHNGNVVMATGQ